MPGDYPFVRLEGHRAVCAICLMDFDEPERAKKAKEAAASDEKLDSGVTSPVTPGTPVAPLGAPVQEVQVEEITDADVERLQLADAGEGPQPLRLLACGHVFHVSSDYKISLLRNDADLCCRKRALILG